MRIGGMVGAAVLATLLVSARDVVAQDCPGDLNGDGNVSVGELVTAVGSALEGCPFPPEPRFVDNGNGTITDRQTRLMWEKKIGGPRVGESPLPDDDLHNVRTEYPVQGVCDGGATSFSCSVDSPCPNDATCIFPDVPILSATDWLNELNTTRFARHSNWRLPTIQELMSLYEYGKPCCFLGAPVNEAFQTALCQAKGCTDITDPDCSCIEDDEYLSSTVSSADNLPTQGMLFDFSDAIVTHHGRAHVRAVRSIGD